MYWEERKECLKILTHLLPKDAVDSPLQLGTVQVVAFSINKQIVIERIDIAEVLCPELHHES